MTASNRMDEKKTSDLIQDLQAQLAAKEQLCLELSQKLSKTELMEERLKSALEIAELGTWEHDSENSLTYFDKRSLDVFGLSEDSHFSNAQIFDLIHPDDRPRVEQEVRLATATNSLYDTEYRIIRPDGQLRWIAVRGHSVTFNQDLDSNRVRFVGTLMDITERRQAEIERDRFFELSLDLLAIASTRTGRWEKINPAFHRTLGWGQEELLAMPFLDIVHPDDRARSEEAIAELASGKNLMSFENRIRCKDGTYRWITWNTVPHSAGGLVYCVGRDTTASRKAQDALARQNELFQAIFSNIPILLVLWDPLLQTFTLNRHTESVLGWTTEDANAGDFLSKVYPDPKYCARVAEYMQSLASGWHEWVCTTKDGGHVPIDWANIHLSDEVMIGIGVDLRERRQSEDALRRSEQRYRMLFENMSEGFFLAEVICDGAGKPVDYRHLAVNPAYETVVGFKREDLVGRTCGELMQIPYAWIDTFGRVALTGRPEQFEGFDDGLNRYFRISAYSPEPGRFACLVQDITERKKFEEQLQALNNALERRVEMRTHELQETQLKFLHAEKLSAIGKLSASIAHEFNNPLQAIMTVLVSLKRTPLQQEGDRVLLEMAIGETERLKYLIRSLQDFYRPSSGKKVLIDVHAVIDSLMLLCKSDFRLKGISTVLQYDKEMPHILAVRDQIKQVLLNLLKNAADACREGDGEITIMTCHDDKRVAIAIKDDGIGIKPEQMDLIFQPFYSTKPEVKGTGLGLSICHGIVQNHQGEIKVESEPGEGSIFTVLLPICK